MKRIRPSIPLFATNRLLIHTTPRQRLAAVDPSWLGTGPPPAAPTPPPPTTASPSEDHDEQRWWLARRRAHAATLKAAVETKRRFWRHVTVQQQPPSSSSSSSSSSSPSQFSQQHGNEEDGGKALTVYLDTRPLRHPTTKQPIPIPSTKPVLAAALALEWDQLVSSIHGATKDHLIPLTSLVCRALDIHSSDLSSSSAYEQKIREEIATRLLNYLDTDALLCWEPSPEELGERLVPGMGRESGEQRELRERQIRAFEVVSGRLLQQDWARIGVEALNGVLDAGSLLPRGQAPGVREKIGAWIRGLDAWELAGLERATLAGKSLVAAARLVVDWSERNKKGTDGKEKKVTVEEIVKATSVEVDWQIGRWGEVQDSHDVAREDLRRQLGGVVLLVGGTGGS